MQALSHLAADVDGFVGFRWMITPPLPLHPIVMLLFRSILGCFAPENY